MKTWQRFAVFGILLFGLFLKLHQYTIYPQRGATSDEYTYSFLGLSLLTKRIPISWSHFGVYKDRKDVVIDKIHFPLVQPYFDHPPLAGLLVGVWAFLNGEYTFEQLRLSTVRLVPIVASIVTSAFVFLLTYKLSNFMTALWALLIYSTVTIFVIQSRVVLAENFFTPVFLIVLYLFHSSIKKMSIQMAVLLGFLSTVAFWMKESALTLSVSLSLLLVQAKVKSRYVVAYLAIVIAGLAAYALYGWIYDWETFVRIISLQGGRDVGPQTLWYLMSTPIIINKVYYDGWYYFGFLALAFLLADVKRFSILLVPVALYFIFLLFSLTEQGQSGWYMIPLFPFMAIATAIVLRDASVKFNGMFLPFLLFVGFAYLQSLFFHFFGLTSEQFRQFLILLCIPYIFVLFLNKKSWLGYLHQAYFYIAIILSIFATYTYVHPA